MNSLCMATKPLQFMLKWPGGSKSYYSPTPYVRNSELLPTIPEVCEPDATVYAYWALATLIGVLHPILGHILRDTALQETK